MPAITMELVKMSKDKKTHLVKEITRITSEVTGLPPETIIVFIKENETDNVGVGGVLLCDRKQVSDE